MITDFDLLVLIVKYLIIIEWFKKKLNPFISMNKINNKIRTLRKGHMYSQIIKFGW
jgi:hypothetical protein